MTTNDETMSAIRIVQRFHHGLNARNVEDIRIGGPRGTGEGKQLLEEWVGRANITMEPQRWFHHDGTVVVEQIARWHDAGTGEETSSQRVATTFGIRDGQITSIARYGNIGEAITSADMDETHAVAVDDQPGDET